MNIPSLNDICGGFRVQLAAMKTTFLLLIVILLNVNADVQQPPVPPTATRPTVDKFMKREHSLMKPFQGKAQNISIDLYSQKFTFVKACLTEPNFLAGAGFGLPYWDFLGTTMVTSSHVRLTADKRSQTGAIWNNQVKYILP